MLGVGNIFKFCPYAKAEGSVMQKVLTYKAVLCEKNIKIFFTN
jgi:hypothetical protein